jgi:hypothetical protein
MNKACPRCGKNLVSDNREGFGGLVLKSRLTFIDDKGNILVRCAECKTLVSLPLHATQTNEDQK